MTISPNNLYDLPLYYDIAFSWSLSKEAGFLIRALKFHGNLKKLENILEPACGTGRMLREFAVNGISGTGYDISTPCVDYAIKRNQKLELDDKIDILCDDMATACFDSPFDGAFNLVGSFTYLLNWEDIISHLKRTAKSLKEGAAYIIQMTLTGKKKRKYPPQTWTREQGDIEINFTWGREKQDFKKCINHDYSIMKVKDQGKELVFKEKHPQRLWTLSDFKKAIDESGCFRLTAIYDIEQRTVPLDRADLDQLHIPYFVLKSV